MNRFSLPVDEILEALDLSRAQPGIGFLQALFERFNARVPFESASKILRDAQVENPEQKPRRPEVFWTDHLERGAGGTCFARVAAFDALLRELGFSTRKVLGRVERDFDHAGLLVSHESRLWICDVGFPLPALLPAGEATVETALSELSLSLTARGYRVDFRGGVPDGPRGLEIFVADVSQSEFEDRWRDTFSGASRFLSGVVLRRCDAGRVLSFTRGELRVDDRHSRLTVPLSEPRAESLSEIFEIDRGLLQGAFSAVGDPPPAGERSRLAAYLESTVSAEAAFAAVGSREGYCRWMGGVAGVVSDEDTLSGWRITLEAPREAATPAAAEADPEAKRLLEEVTVDPARRALLIARRSSRAVFTSELRVEERRGATQLVREVFFDSPRTDLLRNDSLRGRLAGALAVDLLAWARMLR